MCVEPDLVVAGARRRSTFDGSDASRSGLWTSKPWLPADHSRDLSSRLMDIAIACVLRLSSLDGSDSTTFGANIDLLVFILVRSGSSEAVGVQSILTVSSPRYELRTVVDT